MLLMYTTCVLISFGVLIMGGQRLINSSTSNAGEILDKPVKTMLQDIRDWWTIKSEEYSFSHAVTQDYGIPAGWNWMSNDLG